MTSSSRRCAGWLAGVLTLAAVTLVAQTPPAPPAAAPRAEEPPKNLQVLPKDLTRRQVIDIMRGFTAALDVQCTFCHLAKDPKDPSTIDFADDSKEEKKSARVMIGMVKAINSEYLPRVAEHDEAPAQVRCITCHHGQVHPRTLEQALESSLAHGAQATLREYKELRDKYYGRAVYDFGPDSLALLGQRLAREEKLPDALAILEFNAQQYPDSTRTLAALADAQAASGNREAAIATLKKLLVLAPEDARAKQRLEELSKAPVK